MVYKNPKFQFSIKLFRVVFAVVLFSFFSAGAIAHSPKIFAIASIDNQIITNLDLNKRYDFFVKTSNIKISSPSEKKFITEQLTQKLIEEKVQAIAAKNLNISVSDEEIEKALAEISAMNGKKISEIQSYFYSQNISYEDYLSQIKSQLLWKKVVNSVVTPRIKISQAEIDEMIELSKIDNKKTKLHLAEIFIPFKGKKEEIEARSLAQKLIKEINDGGNFKDIARQFSRSASSEFDGEIGWVEAADLDQKIFAQIKDLEKGKISDTIKTETGFYIFKILDKKTVSKLEESDINQLRNIILGKKLKAAAKGYLEDLKKKTYIKRY